MLIKHRKRNFLFDVRLNKQGNEYVELRDYEDNERYRFFLIPPFAWDKIKEFILATRGAVLNPEDIAHDQQE